ncbi:uncharacterized protein N7446_007127 [Penicillium canescens]|uniref:Uncharacterized protein n=1 Tax=Penicillium canescens TaxID=5083 RepID=A0AAD6IKW9_PENCN|nr:uncharacterized protein N7446_007127 [Penicillium canescens]KAJ6049545.1 hypothetical protein N7444_006261 [Penicillium canescens]KAJ6052487.1 hypothetical protein N7460_003021 [Penicillium canescens]KAJ6063007.1 hypothetical protein N7446_007127 [Penicillium canescens]
MKPHRAHRFLRKVLEFFHLSPPTKRASRSRNNAKLWCAATAAAPFYSAAAQDFDDVRKDGQSNDIAQYSLGANLEKPISTREQLELRIVKLWKTVWLGLYQINDNEERYHVERLEALYLGAGMTRTYRLGELRVLRRRFMRTETNNGIAAMKLFPDLSLSTLLAVVHILEAYESEIPNLKLLYSILQNGQLGLYENEDAQERTAVVRSDYDVIAEPMEKRIHQYDIRMDVLNMEICDEAMGFHDGLKGQHVYTKVFPNRW